MRKISSKRRGLVLMALLVLLFVSAVLSAGVGAADVSPKEIIRVVLSHITGSSISGGSDAIIWNLRLPRIALALLVGASLATAGALMQSLFHNPMADPYVVGASSGAALGAVTVFALGIEISVLGLNAMCFAALLGGLFVSLLVYWLSRRGGRVPVGTLLLTGIAVGGIMQAFTTFILLQRPSSELREVVSWLMGSLANRDWPHVIALLPYTILGLGVAMAWRKDLNILALGDETAHSLGVPLERTKVLLLLVASTLAAASVAVSGIIAFVGLIVPHLMRLLVGPNHRVLLPACVLGGGLILVWADVLARVIIPGGEVPIGIVTSVLGSLFFLYLLRSRDGKVF